MNILKNFKNIKNYENGTRVSWYIYNLIFKFLPLTKREQYKMNSVKHIDKVLKRLSAKRCQNRFDSWSKDDTKRYYGSIDRCGTKPKEHSNYPGFEYNLQAQLCGLLAADNPHAEWPYISYIKDALNKLLTFT
jgi:hypothetical protein